MRLPAPLLLASLALLSCPSDKETDTTDGNDNEESSLKIAPVTLAFGAVPVGGEPVTKAVAIGNGGTATGNITGIQVFGEASGYSVTGPTPPFGVDPMEQITLQVNFSPKTGGDLSGSVQIITDDPAVPYAIISMEGSGDMGGDTDTDPTTITGNNLDVFILYDKSYNYSCYHPDLESFAEQLVAALFDTFENVAVGLGTYDDYAGSGGGAASGGNVYQVRHLISTNESSVIDAAQGLTMDYGGDAYGSAYEAVAQAAMGLGYDHDCDGVYESITDVPPFKASEDDLFHGAGGQIYDASVAGVGDRAGVGWRYKSTHIILLTADNIFRDTTSGGLPAGSCTAATSDHAAKACTASDVKVLGVNVYEYQSGDSTLQRQLESFAIDTESMIDLDGDGINDDPAVLFGSWNWPEIRDVVEAIQELKTAAEAE